MSMYELVQVSERCWYVQSPTRIGLVQTGERDVCLIDSGSDKDAGRRVRQHLDAGGWRLAAIYATHAHADHIGGAQYLQKQTGCRVYAPGVERDFAAHPVLEPVSLYGGYPCRDLRHKFLMAQPSDAELLTEAALPAGWELIPLPGHSFDMTGFRTPDGVAYVGDCLASRETLQKYRISFVYDVAAYLDTLERVKTMEAKLFVPAHADPAEDLADLAQVNIDAVQEVAGRILDMCRTPMGFEAILQKLFTDYGLAMDFGQYVLVGSTVRSYLSWLKDAGRLAARFEDNMLLWERI